VKLARKRDLTCERGARGRREGELELRLGDECGRPRPERRAHAGAEEGGGDHDNLRPPRVLHKLADGGEPLGPGGVAGQHHRVEMRGGGLFEQLLDGGADHDCREPTAAERCRYAARGELVGRHHREGSIGCDVAGMSRAAS
jgi:hypothetical protein